MSVVGEQHGQDRGGVGLSGVKRVRRRRGWVLLVWGMTQVVFAPLLLMSFAVPTQIQLSAQEVGTEKLVREGALDLGHLAERWSFDAESMARHLPAMLEKYGRTESQLNQLLLSSLIMSLCVGVLFVSGVLTTLRAVWMLGNPAGGGGVRVAGEV